MKYNHIPRLDFYEVALGQPQKVKPLNVPVTLALVKPPKVPKVKPLNFTHRKRRK